jgi:hypothetical protein
VEKSAGRRTKKAEKCIVCGNERRRKGGEERREWG